MPGGSILAGQVSAISVSDKTGSRIWLAQIKESRLEISTEKNNVFWYRNAFDKIDADVRFTYGLGFFEQDVVLRAPIALPSGIDASSAKLEVWSEFMEAPAVQATSSSLYLRSDKNLEQKHGGLIVDDSQLNFGAMRMVQGKAYPLTKGQLNSNRKLPIGKQWIKDGSRKILLESIDFQSVSQLLNTLPSFTKFGAKPEQIPGVVLDYILVTMQLWNINFGGGFKTGAAAVGKSDAGAWNVYSFPYQYYGYLNNLAMSDGTPTGVNLTVENAPGQWGNNTQDPMFDTYIYPWNSQSITVTLQGLPAGTYDFYVYGHGAADDQYGRFSLNGYGELQTAYGPCWNQPINEWIEGTHYVHYRLAQVYSGAPVVLYVLPCPVGYSIINGLQICGSYDTDNDSLSDDEESSIGSDPNNPDTDYDGLSDGYEILVYHTYYFWPDTDGDGLNDGQDPNPTNPDPDNDGVTEKEEIDGEPAIYLHSYTGSATRDFYTANRSRLTPDGSYSINWTRLNSGQAVLTENYSECTPVAFPLYETRTYSWSGGLSWLFHHLWDNSYSTEYRDSSPYPNPPFTLPWEKCNSLTKYYSTYGGGSYTLSASAAIRLYTGSASYPRSTRRILLQCSMIDKSSGDTISFTEGPMPIPNNNWTGTDVPSSEITIRQSNLDPSGQVFFDLDKDSVYDITPICYQDWYMYTLDIVPHKVVHMTCSVHPDVSYPQNLQATFDNGANLLANDEDGSGNEDVPFYAEFIVHLANNNQFPSNYQGTNYQTSAYNNVLEPALAGYLIDARFSNMKLVSSIYLYGREWYAFGFPGSGIILKNGAVSSSLAIHEWGHTIGLEHRGTSPNVGDPNDGSVIMHEHIEYGTKINSYERSVMENSQTTEWNQ